MAKTRCHRRVRLLSKVYWCGSNLLNTNRTRGSMFETLMNMNRTRVLFGSVRCGAAPEQTKHDLENVLFGFFVRLAISDIQLVC